MNVARYPISRCTIPNSKQAPGKRLYTLSKTVYSKEHKMVESGSLKFV